MNEVVLLRAEILWLLLLLLPFLLLGATRLAGLTRPRRLAAVSFQALAVTLLIGALAEPVLVKPDPGMNLVVVLDASDSLSPQSRQRAQQYANDIIAGSGPNDTLQFVAFGARAVVLSPDQVQAGLWPDTQPTPTEATPTEATPTTPTTGNRQPTTDNRQPVLSTQHSDLAAGLRLGGSLLRDTGRRRVLLLSDGWETQGEAAVEAERLAGRGIDLQVVALTALGEPEVIVKYLATTPYARIGDTIQSDLRIYSTSATSATLEVRVDGGAPAMRQVSLAAGENQVPLEQRAESEGYHQVEVRVVSGADTSAENNSASSTTVVKPMPRVLVLEERRGEGYTLATALVGQQMEVVIRGVNAIPALVSELDEFDAIVLDNVAATSLTLDQQRTLQEFVRGNGKGLVVVGGTTAYARGGYSDSVFEQMLPVSSEPAPRPEQGQTALVLIVDQSFSMTEDTDVEGNNKLTMARAAAVLAVDSLRQGDYLGVLSFSTDFEWAVPISPIVEEATKERAKERIRRIYPGGGTRIYPAVVEAAAAIRQINAPSKHVVLLTDGRERRVDDYGPLLNQLREDGVSVSTIGIGRDVDREFLIDMATRGQGRFYFTERIQNIPKILFKEMDLALKESAIEGLVTPQILAPSPVLHGFRPQDVPELQGYGITLAKDEAVVGLISDKGDPLLAHWNYGLGRVVAFTSDSGREWAADWLRWSDFPRFWSQAVRWTMASPANRYLQPSIAVGEQDGSPVARIRVESLQPGDSFVDLADVTAALRSPSGVVTTTLLAQTAPGRYEATVPVGEPGAYEVRLRRVKDGGEAAETIGFSVPPSAELLQAGTNDRLLNRLAAGKPYLAEPGQALDPSGLQGRAPDSEQLWAYLLAPALIALLLSVAARRIDFRRKRRVASGA